MYSQQGMKYPQIYLEVFPATHENKDQKIELFLLKWQRGEKNEVRWVLLDQYYLFSKIVWERFSLMLAFFSQQT